MDRPVETRTITESATISLEFVIQEGSKGHYKIVRDGVTIIDKKYHIQLNNSESLLIIIVLCCLQSGRYSSKIYDSKASNVMQL